MARVRLVQTEQAPPEIQELFKQIEGKGAKVLNLFRAIANSPNVLRNFMRLGVSLLSWAKLSPKLRELAILRVAKLSASEYEWTQHVPIALGAGVRRDQIETIADWKKSTSFSDEERAVLQYTDEVAQDVKVKEKTFKVLQGYLNEQEIVELTLSIGYWGMVARVLVPLQVQIEEQSLSSAKDLLGSKPA
ncbi:MAG: carboxymuconolactone decarboxylase family protein [Chloroflexi bacterium]|nr:carboxymuconolactone decarboxylase family protein [Chloroflexota bacterium]